MVETVCGKDIVVLDVQIDGSATDLLLTEFDGKDFVVREGHLLQDDDVPVPVLEASGRFKNELWSEFNGLNDGCLAGFLIAELDSELIKANVLFRRIYILCILVPTFLNLAGLFQI